MHFCGVRKKNGAENFPPPSVRVGKPTPNTG